MLSQKMVEQKVIDAKSLLTVATVPPVFFANSSSGAYSLSNDTFIVSCE
jgi:hypothetical protein